MTRLRHLAATLLAISLTACATTPSPLPSDPLTEHSQQTGTHWGLLVTDLEGNTVAALNPDQRFATASALKSVTTAAALQKREAITHPDIAPGTMAYLEPAQDGPPALILHGGGDAMLTDSPDCTATCLHDLADQIAATGLTQISHVIGDDTLFPDERWGRGWSQEDMQYWYGTAVSALTVNANLIWLDVRPAPGGPALLTWHPGDNLYALKNDTLTTPPGSETQLRVERLPGETSVRVYGEIAADAGPQTLRLGIADPALVAAQRLQRHLATRGITAQRPAAARHRPLQTNDEATALNPAPSQTDFPPLIAALPPSPLSDTLTIIMKDSQNLHAEILLRRLALITGSGGRDQGIAVLSDLLREAGAPEVGHTVSDGSGLSIYNRLSPRALSALMTYAARQPWFEEWRATFPIGGQDGTLARRFTDTPLDGKLWAKSGTATGTNALTGYMQAASGQTLAFTIFANNRPLGTPSARREIDRILLEIAAEN